MRPRLLLALVLFALPPQRAQAQFSGAASVEHFHWEEDTEPKVEENGPRATIILGWTQRGSSPLRLGYQATFYGGYVRYRGSLLFEPGTVASGTTSYTGTIQEALLRVRASGTVDIVGGVGLDLWLRRLAAKQREDFTVPFVRLGVEASAAPERGWLLAAGLKFPIATSEDTHLTLLGFDQNPMLKPRGKVSGFGHVAYRIDSRWSVVGYLDGFHFKASPPVTLTSGGAPAGELFQPRADLRILGLRLVRLF